MRIQIFILSAFLLLSACTKTVTDPLPAPETWLVASYTYHKDSANWAYDTVSSLYDLRFYGSGTYNCVLTLTFLHKPLAGNSYKIVSTVQAGNEVAVNAWDGGEGSSSDGTGKYINVSNYKGKLLFTVGNATLRHVTFVFDYDEPFAMNVSE